MTDSPSWWLISLHPVDSPCFLFSFSFCPHAAKSSDSLVKYVNTNFANLHLSSSAFISPQCTPIVGHGFVLDKYKCQCRRGFYHPSRVALNGFKSRLQIPLWYKNTFCSELSDQNFEYFRSKLLGFMKKKKNTLFFPVGGHTFSLKFFLCLWMGVLGLVGLWNLHLQSKDSSCSYCGSVYLLRFYSELRR